MTGIHSVCTPGELLGKTIPRTRSLRLVAEHAAGSVHPVSGRQDFEIETPGQGIENTIHLPEDEGNLIHVLLAHVLGQSGGSRLLSYEVIARLRTLTHGKLAGHEDLAGPLHHLDQLGTRDFAQSVAGSLGAAHIASNHSGNSLASPRLRVLPCRSERLDPGQDFRTAFPSEALAHGSWG